MERDAEGRLLCFVCGKRPLPPGWSFVGWCDDCLTEFNALPAPMDVQVFKAEKRG